jgi:hypothetical protein
MPSYSVPEDVVFRDLAGEAVILNLSTGIYFGLDEIGTRIWQLLTQHGDKEKLIQEMLSEYEVEEGKLRRDVDALLKELLGKGLLIDVQKVA